jgi:hypothetical protein
MFGSNRKILAILFTCIAFIGNAQISKLEVSGIYGYHFASNVVNKTGASLNGYIKGVEFGFGKNGIGNSQFQKVHGAQKVMLNFRAAALNNIDTFGYVFGILPSLHLPVSITKNQALRAKISYGINFNSQQYNKETNFDNRAISSPINFGLDLGIDWEINLKEKYYLLLSPGVYHISNGSIKMPNGGINLLYLKAGFGLNRGKPNQEILKHNYELAETTWKYWLYGFATHREYNYFANLDRFWVFGLNQNLQYQFNQLYALGVGLDFHYDATQSLTDASKKLYQVKENEKYLMAIGISQRFSVGKFFLPFGVYTYFMPLNFIKEPVYIRFGLGYNLGKKWFIGSFFKGTINSKGQLKSDFMEWSLGYRFKD